MRTPRPARANSTSPPAGGGWLAPVLGAVLGLLALLLGDGGQAVAAGGTSEGVLASRDSSPGPDAGPSLHGSVEAEAGFQAFEPIEEPEPDEELPPWWTCDARRACRVVSRGSPANESEPWSLQSAGELPVRGPPAV